jgi:hypothetical protein
MALDPALPFEGLRHDIDPEVRLSARPVAGMTFVLMGFIEHAQAFGCESLGQLLRDEMFGSRHGSGLASGGGPGQSRKERAVGRASILFVKLAGALAASA